MTASLRQQPPAPKRSTATCDARRTAPGARLLDIRFALRRRDMGRLFIAAHSAPGASRLIRALASRTDVYFGVCLRTRRAGDATRSTARTSRSSRSTRPTRSTDSANSRTPPSMIVTSGTPGTRTPTSSFRAGGVPELERANRRLARALGGDPACVDAARILRPAGLPNHKHQPPRAVKLIDLEQADGTRLTSYWTGSHPPDRPLRRGRRSQNDADRARRATSRGPVRRIRTRDRRGTAGGDGKLDCPFHDDRTPAFSSTRTAPSTATAAARRWLHLRLRHRGALAQPTTKGRGFLELRQPTRGHTCCRSR